MILASIRIPDLLVGLNSFERIWIERKVAACWIMLPHALDPRQAPTGNKSPLTRKALGSEI